MNRRVFLILWGAGSGAQVLRPRAVRAQQSSRMRRIGVLTHLPADDPESPARIAAFVQGLQHSGWFVGGNVRIDYRWAASDADRVRYATELVALAPDVILATSGPIVGALQQASHTVPIVFVLVIDPVAGGWVASLARPGRNAAGFSSYDSSMSEKWLELLKEISPGVTRVGVIRDPAVPAGSGEYAALRVASPPFGVALTPIGVHDADDVERGITAFAREPNGGLIVGVPSSVMLHRDLIITLAARHRLPAVYAARFFVTGGGLISYGPDVSDQYRRAASYVDRILNGEKPGDLPVQAPTKFEMTINLKTARALGLTIPPPLLARVDEVIE